MIAHKFSPPLYQFEEGFEEEDLLWTPDTRETKEQVAERAAMVLDTILTQDTEACQSKLAMFDGEACAEFRLQTFASQLTAESSTDSSK